MMPIVNGTTNDHFEVVIPGILQLIYLATLKTVPTASYLASYVPKEIPPMLTGAFLVGSILFAFICCGANRYGRNDVLFIGGVLGWDLVAWCWFLGEVGTSTSMAYFGSK